LYVCAICHLWLLTEDAEEESAEPQLFKLPDAPPLAVCTNSHVSSASTNSAASMDKNAAYDVGPRSSTFVSPALSVISSSTAVSWIDSAASMSVTEGCTSAQSNGLFVSDFSVNSVAGPHLQLADQPGCSTVDTASIYMPLTMLLPMSTTEQNTPICGAESFSSNSLVLSGGGSVYTPVSQTMVGLHPTLNYTARTAGLPGASELAIQQPHTATSDSVSTSVRQPVTHTTVSTATAANRSVSGGMTLRDTLSQIMADIRSLHQKQDHIVKLLESLPGRSSDEGTELDLGQLTLPVNTEDELEQLAQILNDRAMRRRLVSAVYWYMNVVLVDSILQLTSSCVR